jgi:cytochrome c oxidase subunit 1
VLSMGAVFAIFAGFYYWWDKFFGVMLPNIAGKIHFWLTFVGVNLTFFPMHFLGLAGMPRRIPDYPDGYLGWNQLATIGSNISLYGFLFFIFMLWVAFFNAAYRENN